jgi:hypothetical protein
MLARNFERCAARARSRGGQPCQAPPVLDAETRLPRNGRCKLHGGKSTGPRTPAGRRRIEEAQRKRWENWATMQSANVPESVVEDIGA